MLNFKTGKLVIQASGTKVAELIVTQLKHFEKSDTTGDSQTPCLTFVHSVVGSKQEEFCFAFSCVQDRDMMFYAITNTKQVLKSSYQGDIFEYQPYEVGLDDQDLNESVENDNKKQQ